MDEMDLLSMLAIWLDIDNESLVEEERRLLQSYPTLPHLL